MEAPQGTGARECVQSYFEAIIHQNWQAAYACLDPICQRRWNLQQFTQRAQNYRSGLKLDPKFVFIRDCEEQNQKATAHVVLSERADSPEHRFKDAISLSHNEGGWQIVLPTTFGRNAKR